MANLKVTIRAKSRAKFCIDVAVNTISIPLFLKIMYNPQVLIYHFSQRNRLKSFLFVGHVIRDYNINMHRLAAFMQ